MQNMEINNINISPSVVIPSIPPWLFPKPYVDLILKDKMQTNEIFLTKNIVKQHLNQEFKYLRMDLRIHPAVCIPHFKYRA